MVRDVSQSRLSASSTMNPSRLDAVKYTVAMSVSSHPVEWVAHLGANSVAAQHDAGKPPPQRRVGQDVRDDAVELKRLWRIAQGVDHRVSEPALIGVVDDHRGPPRRDVVVIGGQLVRRPQAGTGRQVAALDAGQPHLLGPHDRAEYRPYTRLLADPVEDDLAR